MQRFYNILCLSIGCLVCLLSSCSIQPLADKVSFESSSSPVSGYLHFPSSEGPHPVVIDLHGCDGILPARNQLWLPKLTGAGFAVLQLDSFTRRGVTNICGDLFRVPPMVRSMDVATALRWILSDERFDHDGIFLIGMSHGATTSLLTQLRSDSIFLQLKGVIAFYPYCYDTLPVLNSDLLVLIGDKDDWTPADRCRDMHIINRAGYSYDLVVYPNAYHSFDVPGGNLVYFGHRIQYNAVASQDSVRRVIDFLNNRKPNKAK